jgi:hypothetical protein
MHPCRIIWLGIYLILNQVVGKESSIIGDARENRAYIHANHVDMVKFSTRDDPGYKSVLDAIERLLEDHNLAPANQSM